MNIRRTPRRPLEVLMASVLLGGGSFAPSASAQCEFLLDREIALPTGAPFTGFDDALAVRGDLAVIATDRAGSGGEAHVYRRRCPNWDFEQTLTPSFGTSTTFGYSAAVGGNTILLGNSDVNAVFVFRHRGGVWVEEQVLTVDPATEVRQFGYSLSLEEDQIAVGAPGNIFTSGIPLNPSVFIYRLLEDTWVEEALVQAPVTRLFADFGVSVAISSDRLAVGTPPARRVSLYVRRNGVWSEEPELEAPVGFEGSFGTSLDFDENLLLVGAPNPCGVRDGAAFLHKFRPGGRIDVQRINPSSSSPGFGVAVSIDRPDLIVGDSGGCGAVPGRGRVVVFRESGLSYQEAQVLSADGATHSFGHDLALSERTLLVGEIDASTQTSVRFYSNGVCGVPDPAPGSVNAGFGNPVDVLFLNGESGGISRTVEYDVLGPFRLFMNLPPSLSPPDRAPFALYLWPGRLPDNPNFESLPLGIGCTAMPTPLTGGNPKPVEIWNNARRFQALGRPTRPSSPAPSLILDRPKGLGLAQRFFLQGLIYDPASAGLVPASVTNGIIAVPVFGQ